MASKVISITEEVYKLLKSVQLPEESFGDTIKRLCNQMLAKNLLNIVQNDFKDEYIPEDIWDSFEKDIKEIRKRSLASGEIEF